MRLKAPEDLTSTERIAYYDCEENKQFYQYDTRGGWEKYYGNPVLGGEYGTCFDMSVLLEKDENGEEIFKMWFSWRPKKSIGYTVSPDGIHWECPRAVLSPEPGSDWEADEINRPAVIRHKDKYYMWYSGQMKPYREEGRSVIGLAESLDGIHWTRRREPVMVPDQLWEKKAIMCPCVNYDREDGIFKMWYSAGCNHEPDAIGYATSRDGIRWTKCRQNPIVTPKPGHLWEQHKVVACHVIKEKQYYYMFYVGHLHEERAQIGLARSKDGITAWEEFEDNPIICPTSGSWDSVAVYKPFVIKIKDQYLMWYNGAAYEQPIWVFEQIGLAILNSDHLF